MLDGDAARWISADAAAARMVAAAIVAERQDPAWTAAMTQATDLLALVLYALAVQRQVDPASLSVEEVRDAFVGGVVDRLDSAVAGTERADWRSYLRRRDGSVTAVTAEDNLGRVLAAASVAQVYGLRLLDRVLAPLPGRDALYPGQLVEVLSGTVGAGDAELEVIVQVKMDHHRDDYNLVAVSEVLLDIDMAGDGRRAGTHAHAVRCAVADLRRAADGMTRPDPEPVFAFRELLARTPHYTKHEDLHLTLMSVCATVLATSAALRRRLPWRPEAPFTQEVLAATRRGLDRLYTAPFSAAEREQHQTFLLEAARTLESLHL